MGSYLDLDDAAFGHPKAEHELHLIREHIKSLEIAITNTELKYLKVLAEIQNMCIGKITMNYELDEMYIGELIATVTGMTNPQINQYIAEQES